MLNPIQCLWFTIQPRELKNFATFKGIALVIFLGTWGGGFVKFLTSIDVVVLVIVVLITCIEMISLQTPAGIKYYMQV